MPRAKPKTPIHAVVLERLAEIKRSRLAGPHNVSQLADDIGVDRTHFYREVTDERSFRPDRRDAVAKHLGLTVEEFEARVAAKTIEMSGAYGAKSKDQ